MPMKAPSRKSFIHRGGRPMSETVSAHAHQFDDSVQQHEASWLGMWIFLATEVMFFGGMFLGYTIYRSVNPQAFAHASNQLDVWLGSINTAVFVFRHFSIAPAGGAPPPGPPPIGGKFFFCAR